MSATGEHPVPMWRLGPLTVRHQSMRGPLLRHGPLRALLIARVSEVSWHGLGLVFGLRFVRPERIEYATLAGIRRLPIRPPGGWVVPLLLTLVVAGTAVRWRSVSSAGHGRG